jgi:TP901 family phage tail tape measure protein
MSRGEVRYRLVADDSQFAPTFEKAEKMVGRFAQSAQALGSKLSAAVTVPLTAAAVTAIKFAADFDKAMNQSVAIIGNLDSAMRQKMEKTAREVALTTVHSATDAAKSYYYLASAGMTAVQAVSAMPRVAAFAQAGMMDMARATEYLNDSQKALGLSSQDAAKNTQNLAMVSDVLVKASVQSNATIEQLAQSLTNKAGPAMRMHNISVQEGVAVLAAYADQGVKGEVAGERFDILIRELTEDAYKHSKAFKDAGISIYDHAGHLRNLADIVKDFEKRLGGMSDAQKTAQLSMLGIDARAQSAIVALLGMSEKVRQYQKDLEAAGGTTQEIADKQMQSFSAQLEQTGKNVKDLSITLGQGLMKDLKSLNDDLLKPGVARAKEWAEAFAGAPAGVRHTAEAVGIFMIAAGPMLYLLGGLAGGLKNSLDLLKLYGPTTLLAAASLGRFAIGLAGIAAAGGVGWAFGTLLRNLIEERFPQAFAWLDRLAEKVYDLAFGFDRLAASQGKAARLPNGMEVLPGDRGRFAGRLGPSPRVVSPFGGRFSPLIREEDILLGGPGAGRGAGGLLGDPEEAKRRAKKLQEAIDSLTGKKAQQEMNDLAIAVGRAGMASIIAANQLQPLKEQILQLIAAGAHLPAALQGIPTLPSLTGAARDRFQALAPSNLAFYPGARQNLNAMVSAGFEMDRLGGTYSKTAYNWDANIATATKHTYDWSKALQDVAHAFQVLGVNAESVLGRIVGGISAALAGGHRIIEIFTGARKNNVGGKLSLQDKLGMGLAGLETAAGILAGPGGLKGAGMGVMSGAAFGASVGSIIPGVGTAIGAGVGAVAGGILGLFGHKKDPKPEIKSVETAFSDLQRAAERAGSAGSFAMGRMIEQAEKLGKMTPEMKAFQKSAIEEMAGTASGVFGGLKDGKAVGGLNISSEKSAEAQGTIFALNFWAAVDKLGRVQAVDALAAPFEALKQKLQAGGFDVDKILGPISQQFERMNNPEVRSALEVVDALRMNLDAMGKSGLPMNIEQLHAYETAAQDAFTQSLAGQEASKENYQDIAPLLQSLIYASQRYGIVLDDNTQNLIDQAKEAGVAFNTDPQLEQLDVMKQLLKTMQDFVSAITGIPARRDVEIHTTYTNSGSPPDPPGQYGYNWDGTPDNDGDKSNSYATGFGQSGDWRKGFGRVHGNPIVQVHDQELMWIIPKGQKPPFITAAAGFGGKGMDEAEWEPRTRWTGGGDVSTTSGGSTGGDVLDTGDGTALGALQSFSDDLGALEEQLGSVVGQLAGIAAAVSDRPSVAVQIDARHTTNVADNSIVRTVESQAAFERMTRESILKDLKGRDRRLVNAIDERIRDVVRSLK